jgi:hypothetical protein
MATCKCGKKIVFIGYELVEVNEEGEEVTDKIGSYGDPQPSEESMQKTQMYACKDYPFCKYSRKMTYSQMREYEEEQDENSDLEEFFDGEK